MSIEPPQPNFSYGWEDTSETNAHSYVWPPIRKLLSSNTRLRVVDLGCGNGVLANKVAQLGHETIGIDASADGIELARQAFPKVRFEVGSVYEDLARFTVNADVVITTEVIEHLYFPKRLFQSARSLLRDDGTIIVTTPYHGYLKNLALAVLGKWDSHHDVSWDGGHIKFFSVRTLREMALAAKFNNVEFRFCGRMTWLWKSMICIATKSSA